MGDKLNRIRSYIDNYDKCCNNKLDSYYDIFKLSRDSNINDLKREIKKLRILFHPDLVEYIPSDIKEKFKKLSKFVVEMENVFDNNDSKLRYDSSLKENDDRELKVFTIKRMSDIEKFNYITNKLVMEYGFMYTFNAIYELVKYNKYDGFCVNDKIKKLIFDLGRVKVKQLLMSFRNTEKSGVRETIISYLTNLISFDDNLSMKLNSYVDGCSDILDKYGRSSTYYSILNMYENKKCDKFDNNLDIIYRDALILILIYFESLDKNDPEFGCYNLIELKKEEIIKIFILVLQSKMKEQNCSMGRR